MRITMRMSTRTAPIDPWPGVPTASSTRFPIIDVLGTPDIRSFVK
jgi:hypothetical protein